MNRTVFGRALRALALLLVFMANGTVAEKSPDEAVTTDALIADAETVIQLISSDNVQASKQADKIFAAATRLFDDGRIEEAKVYFQTGLQLAPWDMSQQLNFAKVLLALGENDRAISVAKLVYETSEDASLLLQSSEISGIVSPTQVAPLPAANFDKPVIVLVPIGEVDDWIVQSAGARLFETLGSPVYVSSTAIALPAPHRSYFQRWSEQLKKDIDWGHPFVREQMRDIGIVMPELATTDQTLEILARITVAQGHADPRPNFESLKQEARARDRQWDANRLLTLLQHEVPARADLVVIGLTQADIYAGDTNFVFGTADMGSHYALVSTQRFEAEYNGERENQQRFLDRLHKQLLSSSGFALDIPRPTDPRSARSYPNGLADHDLKGTWLSQSCIDAFALALGHPLPEDTVQASLAN